MTPFSNVALGGDASAPSTPETSVHGTPASEAGSAPVVAVPFPSSPPHPAANERARRNADAAKAGRMASTLRGRTLRGNRLQLVRGLAQRGFEVVVRVEILQDRGHRGEACVRQVRACALGVGAISGVRGLTL